jgi:uncharacterized protein
MKHMEKQVLMQVFLEEESHYRGKPTYQELVEYLHHHSYAGVTVIRGLEGYGRKLRVHGASQIDLSTSLPLVVEIIESPERIQELEKVFEETGMIDGALVTEQKIDVVRFSDHN